MTPEQAHDVLIVLEDYRRSQTHHLDRRLALKPIRDRLEDIARAVVRSQTGHVFAHNRGNVYDVGPVGRTRPVLDEGRQRGMAFLHALVVADGAPLRCPASPNATRNRLTRAVATIEAKDELLATVLGEGFTVHNDGTAHFSQDKSDAMPIKIITA